MKDIETLTVYGTAYTSAELTALIEMLRDKTDGTCGGQISLSERLQRLLDEPCEICDDGRKGDDFIQCKNFILAIKEATTAFFVFSF